MVMRIVTGLVLALGLAGAALAADFTGRARVLPDQTTVQDTDRGLTLTVGLTQGVPYRVFTLDDPARLIADFREVDWTGLDAARLTRSQGIKDARFGQYRPGWTRMILDLEGPLALGASDLRIDTDTGQAKLQLSLTRTTAADFAARSVAPADPDWGMPAAAQVDPARSRHGGDGKLTVVIDPGHGGVDPGAQRGKWDEKNLMLTFGLELRDALVRTGQVNVVLTREVDDFVPLEARVTIAHEARADLFISLHADALEGGGASGATIYTLAEEASDKASQKLAERHNRADLLAGVDLTGQDDVVAHVLMDLARTDTKPRADRIAAELLDALKANGNPMHSRPLRGAGFSVLKAPDIPSVLLEVGFLSSDRDRANLTNPDWRAKTAGAITAAILDWAIADAAEGQLIRQ
ncbi:N-acetylmuramoyl-L-alanine amidase [Donghicola sp. C2-DW-16]|uniref:N-acetylmuramoyl-L-alanine amidase n=2 Tax=Donghicola mangrovi TaxID=2729614 RepID=A0ABX2PD74_9RHOB|nr:N-acetylmuramoyl-L-alanine amidase [Donghicola mangrovi]